MATIAEQWRAAARKEAEAAAVELTLPSGIQIRARRPGPAMLAAHCKLPMGLANAVKGGDERESEGNIAIAAAEMMAFTRDILTECVVEPRIPEDISPSEIPDRDVQFLMVWALRGEEAARLATFRGESVNGRDRGDGRAVPSEAEHAAGDRRSGGRAESGSGGRAEIAPFEKGY